MMIWVLNSCTSFFIIYRFLCWHLSYIHSNYFSIFVICVKRLIIKKFTVTYHNQRLHYFCYPQNIQIPKISSLDRCLWLNNYVINTNQQMYWIKKKKILNLKFVNNFKYLNEPLNLTVIVCQQNEINCKLTCTTIWF